MVGKGLLGTEKDNFADHLYPHQLAVAVRSGAEVLPHLGRQWLLAHADNPDKVLIDFEEGNAHNEVDRNTFLQRASAVAPGICRWLAYIYPTDQPTFVFYRGKVIESRSGGQQGCPLIGDVTRWYKEWSWRALAQYWWTQGRRRWYRSWIRQPALTWLLDLRTAVS